MWILDNRARENKHFRHTDRKEAPSPRICSRDLTIPRRDATPAPMSWISTSYRNLVPKIPSDGTIRFRSLLSKSVEKTVRVFKTLETFNFARSRIFRRIRYFHPLFLRAITVCGKLARMAPKSFLVVCCIARTEKSELKNEICKKKRLGKAILLAAIFFFYK